MSWLLVSCWRLMPAMQLVRRTRCQPHWHYLQTHHAIDRSFHRHSQCWLMICVFASFTMIVGHVFVVFMLTVFRPFKWHWWRWLPNPCPPWPIPCTFLIVCLVADVGNGCHSHCGDYLLVTVATVLVSMITTSTVLWLITCLFVSTTWLVATVFDDWWCASWTFVCRWRISTEVGVCLVSWLFDWLMVMLVSSWFVVCSLQLACFAHVAIDVEAWGFSMP